MAHKVLFLNMLEGRTGTAIPFLLSFLLSKAKTPQVDIRRRDDLIVVTSFLFIVVKQWGESRKRGNLRRELLIGRLTNALTPTMTTPTPKGKGWCGRKQFKGLKGFRLKNGVLAFHSRQVSQTRLAQKFNQRADFKI